MPAIGAMLDRYAFQREGEPVGAADQGEFADVFSCAAQTVYLRGGEGVQAARLQGEQPVVITIRTCTQARQVDNTWRIVDARDRSRVFNITGVEQNAVDRGFIDILAKRAVGQPNG